MNELEQILEDTDLRASAIARLLTLIDRDSEIINRYRETGDSGSYIQHYIELREVNQATLTRLLEANGTIRADLHFRSRMLNLIVTPQLPSLKTA